MPKGAAPDPKGQIPHRSRPDPSFPNGGLVDGYLSQTHGDHPESGCGVAGMAVDAARTGSGQLRYTDHLKTTLAVLADLIDNPDREIADRDAVLTLTVLVGAISIAWAINDPALCERVLTAAATSLKSHVQTH